MVSGKGLISKQIQETSRWCRDQKWPWSAGHLICPQGPMVYHESLYTIISRRRVFFQPVIEGILDVQRWLCYLVLMHQISRTFLSLFRTMTMTEPSVSFVGELNNNQATPKTMNLGNRCRPKLVVKQFPWLGNVWFSKEFQQTSKPYMTRLEFGKMSVLLKAFYNFNTIPIKYNNIFHRTRTKPQMQMEW